MNPFQEYVQAFHSAMSLPIGDYSSPQVSRPELRADLIREEASETTKALRENNMIETVDGLCDVVYVCFGAAVEYGVKLGELSLRPDHFAPTGKPGLPSGKDKEWWIEMLERRSEKAVKDILNKRLSATQALDASCSLILGCMQAAKDFGIGLLSCFEEVQNSNLTKAPPTYNAAGKVQKGPNFRKPDIRRILVQQGWRDAA